jgi:asparagine synthase (glutamine-hydrolysing)
MKPFVEANANSAAIPAADSVATSRAAEGALFLGEPRFRDPDLADIANRSGIAAAWDAGFARFDVAIADRVDGPFAVAMKDRMGRTWLAVDRFSMCSLCYRFASGRLEFAERADRLGRASDLDSQALFDYLYFHVIPEPRTVFKGVRLSVLRASRLRQADGSALVESVIRRGAP